MVVLPELNDDQRLYLKTIFDYFDVEGKWPTYLWVENTILQTHPEKRSEFDLAEMGKSLPDNFATGFSFNHQYGQEAAFIAPVLYYFPEAKEEMTDFIRVVRFCVEKINSSLEEHPEISSEDLSSQLHMQPLAIRKMGLLLQYEPDIFNGSGSNGDWWRLNLKRGKYGVRRKELHYREEQRPGSVNDCQECALVAKGRSQGCALLPQNSFTISASDAVPC